MDQAYSDPSFTENAHSTVIALFSLIFTTSLLFYFAFRKPKYPTPSKNYKTMVVLGSGGHTAEMFKFLQTIEIPRFNPRIYVIADSDTGSQSTMEEFERKQKSRLSKYSTVFIPRSRVVGQSYFTSVFTTLYSFFYSFKVMCTHKPSFILTNGPGTCLPIIVSGWILRYLGFNPCRIVLMESYACVKNKSLTAKLCRIMVDKYCIQWPFLLPYIHDDPQNEKTNVVYTGRIPLERFKHPGALPGCLPSEYVPIPDPTCEELNIISKSYVLVTVGSTLFESLISTLDNEKTIDILKAAGFTGLHLQYGKGKRPLNLESRPGFDVLVYDYMKQGWQQEVANASLVIGHAGAGTILDSLEAKKPIIVITNSMLMSQHQSEIADVMCELQHLFVIRDPSSVLNELPTLLKKLPFLKVFPPRESTAFACTLDKILPKTAHTFPSPSSATSHLKRTRSAKK